ncbi:hypothetical protein A2382_01130 [Candidatus Woesebacteria bacterium RIFOXYB1_FULL_38_16]|uniref:Uncharacterized protein n=1 Tax=Candidatus Woesebacteria bacterium RIFOXYB1_FULL_38_16 TaxID=1802538 RepID=A0A1F8CUE6_9BACT|nr:MAG: hypothetical protein A2191_03605 [Candidatus Woesebacteria bacterium RIFOXYA1_FULL_38_9]OGM79459.1 MAG: hypothetical protein A2382_01130 [Candidatus Woesebacteria bacterium RIFOXYB1_FULL_38_16]
MVLKEARDFLIIFVLALALVLVSYFLVVRKCNVFDEKGNYLSQCKCRGKQINIADWLGTWGALSYPKTEYCIGYAKKVF